MDWGIGGKKENIQGISAEFTKTKASDEVSGHGGLGV